MPKGAKVAKAAPASGDKETRVKTKPKTSIGKKTQDSRKKRTFKSRQTIRHMKKNREKDAQ